MGGNFKLQLVANAQENGFKTKQEAIDARDLFYNDNPDILFGNN